MSKQRVGKYEKPVENVKNQKNVRAAFIKVGAGALTVLAIVTTPAIIHGNNVAQRYETRIEELIASHNAEVDKIKEEYEAQIFNITKELEYGTQVDIIEEEAEYISRVIYGMAKDHSVNDQRAVIWAIINRVESSGYPGTVKEVCQQPKQWIGYSDDNPVLATIYDTVLAELKSWHNDNRRPMDKDFVYLSWSSKEILLRNTFTVDKSTMYWRMY